MPRVTDIVGGAGGTGPVGRKHSGTELEICMRGLVPQVLSPLVDALMIDLSVVGWLIVWFTG